MEEVILRIVKRDGHVQPFDPEKIRQAIIKAYRAGGVHEEAARIETIVRSVTDFARQSGEEVTVEQIQDRVEEELMRLNPFIAKKYIIYREWRTVERDKRTSIKHTMDGIVTIEKNDVNLGNANMSSHTPAGQMMTFASEVTKDYTSKYLLPLRYSRAHKTGDIHIHDLDYYPTKTTTCVQYDIADLYERGFRTKNGSIRTPQSIHSYATLATIIFQTNQNEQHGGQSIPAFDFFMAPGVYKSFVKHLIERLRFVLELREPTNTDLSTTLPKAIRNLVPLLTDSPHEAGRLHEGLCAASFPYSSSEVEIALATAFR
ncbi:anaerobic ribonucleoside-triphosphate reductase, partial [Porphyromonas loveana]